MRQWPDKYFVVDTFFDPYWDAPSPEIRRRYRLKPGGTKWDERLQRLDRLGPLTPFLTFQYVLRARR